MCCPDSVESRIAALAELAPVGPGSMQDASTPLLGAATVDFCAGNTLMQEQDKVCALHVCDTHV